MAVSISVKWVQGQDLEFQLNYRQGPDENSLVTVPLAAGDYSMRMDLCDATTRERLYTFNSDPVTTTDPDDTSGPMEVILADTSPNITIAVPRDITLPGGVLYDKITAAEPELSYVADLFLRDNSVVTDVFPNGKQFKIATVKIKFERSYTLWP